MGETMFPPRAPFPVRRAVHKHSWPPGMNRPSAAECTLRGKRPLAFGLSAAGTFEPRCRTKGVVRIPVGFAGADAPDRGLDRRAPPGRAAGGVCRDPQWRGPALARRLARIGIERVGDLLWQRPRRYEEPVPAKRVSDLFGDEEAVIDVVVKSASSRRRGRLKILTARVGDDSGEIKATWFNQPWLEARLKPGTSIRSGGARTGSASLSRATTSMTRSRRLTTPRCIQRRGPVPEEASRPSSAGARARSRRR